MRQKIAAGNWKMNLSADSGKMLINEIVNNLPGDLKAEVIIAPPFPYLMMAVESTIGTPIKVAAQNCYFEAKGAFTGEVSINMLQDIGVKHCIIGHSERRQLFFESNEIVKQKLDAILNMECTPIFCCGESLETRESGHETEFVTRQLEESLFHLDEVSVLKVIIAYEPIWAIGTGKTATPVQAQEMHASIRAALESRYNAQVANSIRILYGGSVNAANAEELFNQPDVDGGLVGGASLDPVGFSKIIKAAC